MLPSILSILVLAVTFLNAPPLQAADKFLDAGTCFWTDGLCWSPRGVPSGGDNVFVRTQGGVNQLLVIDSNATTNVFAVDVDGVDGFGGPAGAKVVMRDLQFLNFNVADSVRIGIDGKGLFEQEGSSQAVGGTLSLGVNNGSDGAYTMTEFGGPTSLTTDATEVGVAGFGRFEQFGGTHTIATTLSLGVDNNSASSYLLSGGDLFADSEHIGGVGTNGGGIFTQNSGLNEVASNLLIGTDGSGNYFLNGGSLTSGREVVGGSAFGRLLQQGGTNVTDTLVLGEFVGGQGDYQMISSAVSLTVDNEIIGSSGIGNFTQDVGSHTVNDQLTLGAATDSTGNYTLNDGTLTVADETIGGGGTGTFVQTGGEHTATSLVLGEGSGGAGSYTLSGGTLTVLDGNISSGNGASALTIDGGTLDLQGGNGRIDVDTFTIGGAGGSNGAYTLVGTGSVTADSMTVGQEGTGVFTQTGGTNTITNNLTLGEGSGSDGTYHLNGGTLTVNGAIVPGGAASAFNFTDGTLNAAVIDVNLTQQGGVLELGNSPGTTTINGFYKLFTAGTLEIELLGLTPGTEYDQLVVNGGVILDEDLLGGGALDLILLAGFDADVNDVFTIIDNDGVDLITNTFFGLAEGASIMQVVNEIIFGFDISYMGGTGNDLILTVASKVPAVPVPAAAWLFGSALGLLSWMKRRRA